MPTNKYQHLAEIITSFSQKCHEDMTEAGYWKPGDDTPRGMPVKLARIHGEISELLEVYRKGKMHDPCGKPCGLTSEEEEFADIILQTLDAASARGIDIGAAILAKAEFNRSRPHSKQQNKAF